MDNSHKFAFMAQALADRAATHHLRSCQIVEPIDSVQVRKGDRLFLNFSANDYLGLAKHPALIQAAQQAADRYGAGATASRLVVGTYEIHHQLETNLAAATGRDAALLFNSGYQMNATVLPALFNAQSVVCCDRFVHHSLLQGILASGARLIRYRHNDLTQLEQRLQSLVKEHPTHGPRPQRRLGIVTETVFSMEGDCSDVAALVQLSQRYGVILYLDDAHGIGVWGNQGRGLAAEHPGVDLVAGTFGKAFGAFGAFIACAQPIRDYLVNCCPGFVYTTALPPSVVGAVTAALELMPHLDSARSTLHQQANQLRDRLHQLGFDTATSCSQIVPIVLGEADRALALSQWLEQCGILAVAIRPPTVAAGTARIRLALSSHHRPDQLDYLIDCLQRWHP